MLLTLTNIQLFGLSAQFIQYVDLIQRLVIQSVSASVGWVGKHYTQCFNPHDCVYQVLPNVQKKMHYVNQSPSQLLIECPLKLNLNCRMHFLASASVATCMIIRHFLIQSSDCKAQGGSKRFPVLSKTYSLMDQI